MTKAKGKHEKLIVVGLNVLIHVGFTILTIVFA